MPKCIELLPRDWLISNLCYQAIEQVSVDSTNLNYEYVCLVIWGDFSNLCNIIAAALISFSLKTG